MRQAGEPTVEEILESIKQVIARDNRAGAKVERQRRETDGLPASVSVPVDSSGEDDILDLGAENELVPSDDYISDEDCDEDEGNEALLKDEARDAMRDSLAALAMLAEPPAAPQIVRSGETSLEGMVRELLRPALAEWLDKNLPPLVEKMVAAEISRIVGKKR